MTQQTSDLWQAAKKMEVVSEWSPMPEAQYFFKAVFGKEQEWELFLFHVNYYGCQTFQANFQYLLKVR